MASYTPCFAVLSAIGGLKAAAPSVLAEGRLIWIAVAILILLFMFQIFGTENVGNTFASVLSVWFIFIAGIGINNIAKYDPTIIRALNPKYIIDYFKRDKKNAWISLGGVIMSITDSLYWPVFVVAVLAAIIASQALISGTSSIIQQSLELRCFPRVKIVHTSTKHHGQVYIPEINNLLMLACVIVTLTFTTTEKISNAYGIAVVFVTTLTSCFLVVVMIMIWKTHSFCNHVFSNHLHG